MLLEQLLHPGFDPAQGAEATRRYVRRKASIVVLEHRKRETPHRYRWTRVGISERRFYKLLPQFAEKVGGRYQYDHDDVVAKMTASLNDRDRRRVVRGAALDLLGSRGFSDEGARKWLQRHRPEDAVNAWPRGRSTGATLQDPEESVRERSLSQLRVRSVGRATKRRIYKSRRERRGFPRTWATRLPKFVSCLWGPLLVEDSAP